MWCLLVSLKCKLKFPKWESCIKHHQMHKHSTIVLKQKKITRPFIKWKKEASVQQKSCNMKKLINTLDNNTIRSKKLETIVSGRKHVARPFFRRKQCEFLASHGVIIQSVTQSFLKTPVCGPSLTHETIVLYLWIW